jgi:hypothetical protein
MVADCRAIHACSVQPEPRVMRPDPLPSKPLLRDLATAIAGPDQRAPRD